MYNLKKQNIHTLSNSQGNCKTTSLVIERFPDSSFGAIVHNDIVTIIQDSNLHDPLVKAFYAHSLLLFKRQKLTPAQEVQFMKLLPWNRILSPSEVYGPFGYPGLDLDKIMRWKIPGRPEIVLVGEGLVEDHYGIPNGKIGTNKPVMEWHTDGIMECPFPPIATSMYSLDQKEYGGYTLFMSGSFIYSKMSQEDQTKANKMMVHYSRLPRPMHPNGLRSILSHDKIFDDMSLKLGSLYETRENINDIPGEVHPLVWEHHVTGYRAGPMIAPMWVSHIQDVDGSIIMTHEESQIYLEKLLKVGISNQYCHKWELGDFVVWDNRELLHSATSNDQWPPNGTRLLHRIRMSGPNKPTNPFVQKKLSKL